MNENERLKEIIKILKEGNLLNDSSPENLCLVISKLGPTFIKIGQILSNRYDILPKEYCDAFSKLRSNVCPMDFKEVTKILEEEYGNLNEIFSNIEKRPLGSASIAQVHRATLKTGEEVVIKVQRKNIYEIMSLDVKLMKKAINILHLNHIVKIINLNEVIDEMFQTAKEEMNFEMEAHHLEEFLENNKGILYVDVPIVYKKLVTKRTLVMEYIDGISFEDEKQLLENGYDLEEIGLKLANNYIKQAIDDGLFHADPHPDNIIIRDGKIVFIDLGMMGRLSTRTRTLLKKCMVAIIKNDVYEVEKILLNLSTTKEDIDHPKLRLDLERILNKNANTDIKEINTLEFVNSMFFMLKEHHLQLDKNVTMLVRGITVIEGTLEMVSPNINLFLVLSNKLKEESIMEIFSKEQLAKLGKIFINSSSSLSKIPGELSNLLTSLNRGETKVDIEMTNSDRQIDKLEKMLHQMIIGILDAALLLGASMVESVMLRNLYLGFAFLLTTWLFIKMYLDHIHKGL